MKRVAAVHGDRMDVVSDNPAGATFADVMAEGSYRVLIAIPKRFM